MIGIVILVLAIIAFTRNAFKYEPIARFEAITIPTYSLIMAAISLFNNDEKVTFVSIITTVGVGIVAALIQASGAQLKPTEEYDKRHRKIVKLKRNLQYLIGWAIILAFGIGFAMMDGEHVDVTDEVRSELLKDLFTVRNFSSSSSWYVYLQSAVASFVYTIMLIRKEPRVKAAIARRKREKRARR
ncbi:hypothetical protein ABTQ33_04130 [Paucilactobacillus suebicus]|uniref:Hydrophobic protein n=1 Tax=Paucilactobacillus suebicus DSM 5007 = KCTC 3549 TaxID=1423807 RepID=A0A0R1VZD4_9LACO|nr:hypothetical protein [Paucilactobacillus suebicus]KRM10754.1 hypothetical protein FD16_GL001147 [Paucilactobacillus suebicus DSM 5007 = KCTC 3549]